MLKKQLIINTNESETRIALLEKERVAEIFIEHQKDRSIVGDIYKGKVIRVLPGMQSAFVNIGLGRSAFLYGGDSFDLSAFDGKTSPSPIVGGEGEEFDGHEDMDDETISLKTKQRQPIEKILREGQDVLVQVVKAPLGTKGARVSMFISLPGRYLVIMPYFSHIGISRRLGEEEERDRLRSIIKQIKPDDVGVIIRTAAKGISETHLQKDLKYLLKTWRSIVAKEKSSKSPTHLHKDLDLIFKATRDLYTDEMAEIVVDNEKIFHDLKRFLGSIIPGASSKLSYYDKPTPIFDVYGIEMDIGHALSSKIELPSGGYLVIDQTEALTSFDVNTGKYVGHLSAHETILKTNLEAIKKIVEQLRIRNIGGIIVIDFIDMEREADREKVYTALQEELKSDKARSNVLKISELGLVQMTRKRTSESLERKLLEPCPHCNGRGRVRSTATEAYDLLREIRRRSLQTGQSEIKVRVRRDIQSFLLEEERHLYEKLLSDLGLTVKFISSETTLSSLQEAPYEVLST